MVIADGVASARPKNWLTHLKWQMAHLPRNTHRLPPIIVDSLDWKNYGVQNIIDTVCNHKSLDCGSIILCHLGAKYTSQALDEMLTKLQDMGYEIVPVSKLIMTEGYHMDANGMQIKD